MKDGSNLYSGSYYNQFIDIKEIYPLHSRHKLKNNNLDNIKIASRKLPPDFFRPSTRENPNPALSFEREKVLKTPCFGNDKKQSLSLSLIPKDKKKIQFQRERIFTLPGHQTQPIQRVRTRRNLSRDYEKRQQQFSCRQINKRQLGTASQHISSERQKIKFKKITLNDEIYLEEKPQKQGSNAEYENKIRLNIKKFFKQQSELNIASQQKKSHKKGLIQLQKLAPPLQIQGKSRIKKLPPLL